MRITLIFVALLPLVANGADDTGADAPPATDTPTDIVVTATREAHSAADTPASISRMGADQLADISAKNQADSMNRNAGVYVQRGSGSETLMGIRSPVLTGPGGCGAFLVTEDSLPIRPIGFCNQNEIFELNYEQAGTLEILRGPGSAVFGASAVHGVVNVLTPDVADLPAWGVGYETGSDSFNRLRVSGSHDIGESL
ncbi:MAG TPA: TonB-dependent receptor plug domain-containing protein, partial [Steroidobacteraceae bacterium]|nr:TonB-dependent receptor plug domain-containing protein [Steroidobacteraceae bacterium]